MKNTINIHCENFNIKNQKTLIRKLSINSISTPLLLISLGTSPFINAETTTLTSSNETISSDVFGTNGDQSNGDDAQEGIIWLPVANTPSQLIINSSVNVIGGNGERTVPDIPTSNAGAALKLDNTFSQGEIFNSGNLKGGKGGSNAVFGGNGGDALLVSSGILVLENRANAVISGGDADNGGYTGTGITQGHGGIGGDGISITNGQLTLTNFSTATITGGNGGKGYFPDFNNEGEGDGAAAGNAITLTSNNNTITNQNSASIIGGEGGTPAEGKIAGNGGIGIKITGDNNIIVNEGLIAGGKDGSQQINANAIELIGNNNTLELSGNYNLTGNVLAQGTNNTLILSGGENRFALDSLVETLSQSSDSQFSGFDTYKKQNSGIWTLTGQNTAASNWLIEGGVLNIGDQNHSAELLGNITIGSEATLSGLGSVNGTVENNGTIAALNSIVNYQDVAPGNLNMGSLINNGVINLAGSSAGNTLTVNGNYTGGGTLILNTLLNGANSLTDKLIVTGDTSGETGIIVNNIKASGARTLNNIHNIEVVKVAGQSNGIFTLKNRVTIGAYEYFLYKNGLNEEDGNWYLRSELADGNSDKVYHPEAGGYMANMAAASKLFNLNLKDREGRAENSSMWLRQVGSHTRSRDSSGQLHNTTNSYVVQGGGEIFSLQTDNTGRIGVGLIAGYGEAKSKTNAPRTGHISKNTVNGYNTGIYSTWFQDANTLHGAYVDSWIQYSWLKAKVDGQQFSSEDYDINGFSASMETGYRLDLYQGINGNVYFTPHSQIIWSGIKADDHTDINGTAISSSGSDNIQTRLGLTLSREGVSDKDKGTEKLFTTYAEINWLYNSKQAGAILDTNRVQQAGSRHIGELKLGTEGQVNRHLNLWTNVAQQLGGNSYSDTSLTVGIKYRF
ncbi:AIDA-I autotransporter precursor [Pragia fontium]|uniref:autotransporter family protein n=1 Tax=Pragia fontium TaxID=82985 RepID=UPI000E0430AE|nr:autotransporter outer membrane beta-barrel domain-containing protein [Pragia fontium]SUB82679.1 AIDA-I autotransporter precursor [Pragia fontium]